MEFKKLQSDMVAAMKARDKARKDTISSLISAVKKLAIDEGKRDDIPEELVDRAIIKEEKTAQEQVDSCPADREDLKAEYQARLDVIKDVIATKNKGQIMKAVMAELKGKANGKDINQIVGKLCQ